MQIMIPSLSSVIASCAIIITILLNGGGGVIVSDAFTLKPSLLWNHKKLNIHQQPNDENEQQTSTTSSFSSSKEISNIKLQIETEGYESYSRCLSPRDEKRTLKSEDKYAIVDAQPKHTKVLRFVLKKALGQKTISSVLGRKKPGALILLRTGESEWNEKKLFTGWADPDLTDAGVEECEHAARLLLESGYTPDVVYTSRLKRAIRSCWVVVNELNAVFLPIYKSWRLNERMYGALTGLSKKETAEELGMETVQAWRNSLGAKPPPIQKTNKYYPGNDSRYDDLSHEQIPLTESLMDCMERARPLWEYKISKELQKGNNVMVVAHTNTLRGLIKVIDGIEDENIKEVSMPTSVPFVYKFDKEMNPIQPPKDALTQKHASGTFLEKPGLLKEALKRQSDWYAAVPGLDVSSIKKKKKRVTTLEASLLKLKEEEKVEKWVEQFVKVNKYDDGTMNLNGEVADVASSSSASPSFVDEDPSEFEDFEPVMTNALTDNDTKAKQQTNEEIITPNVGQFSDLQKDGVVVLIRHGRTPHNNLGLFTGWEDPPLAEGGVEDARNAGRLLKRHGFTFDVVYSSWLTRAIETAWYVLEELDLFHVPMVKSWRLNERMYGALTGKSKKMVANEYGEEQLKKWRRGFKIRPPPTSSYSLSYPGNDYQRTKYVKDLRIAWTETIFRSFEQRKLVIHRNFPKTESLFDCMERSIPFYTKRIIPEAVNKGKRILITSHENALRGILMHLCDIPVEAMNQLHLPNGLPLVYNIKGKCISLLDDGSGKDPMEVHDFGPAAKYLFKPCELDDDFFDQMEKQAQENQKKEKEGVVTV